MRQFRRLSAIAALGFSLLSANVLAQTVRFETSAGNFEVKLNSEKAPTTVSNFLRYVNDGSYKGSLFHRVIPNFMAQAGGFSSDFSKLPSYEPIQNESQNGLSNRRGSIAMARTNNPHSATRQFFINVVDNEFLDAQGNRQGYAVFGEVTQGMDVIDSIVKQPTGSGPKMGMRDVPKQAIIINNVSLIDTPTATQD